MSNDDEEFVAAERQSFATTHWSLVLAAGHDRGKDADDALTRLCATYWFPLYAYVRRRTADADQARDLIQEFFAVLLEKGLVADADPARGRFRSFLLTACKRFLINEWHKAHAAKRGGRHRRLVLDFDSGDARLSHLAVDRITPEQLYERQWALTLLDVVLEKLRAEFDAKEKKVEFDVLKQFLAGSPGPNAYAEAARTMTISEEAAKVAAHRLRKRYRELLRSEIAQTVAEPGDIDDEISALFAILSR